MLAPLPSKLCFECRAAVGALDIFDDFLAGVRRFLSYHTLLGGYDERQTVSWQISLIGPIGADVRHASKPIIFRVDETHFSLTALMARHMLNFPSSINLGSSGPVATDMAVYAANAAAASNSSVIELSSAMPVNARHQRILFHSPVPSLSASCYQLWSNQFLQTCLDVSCCLRSHGTIGCKKTKDRQHQSGGKEPDLVTLLPSPD